MTTSVASERAVTFECRGDPLIGILHMPGAPSDVGLVVIVGGPQYRVGSHRQFVQLARALSGAGIAVLRFDCRGMGDSAGERRSFEAVDEDIAAAIDALVRHAPTLKRVVLWGLCDGASAALLYVHDRRDMRVCGLCLLNPWVRSEVSLAQTQIKHYYAQRLVQRDFWTKFFRGKVAAAGLTDAARSLRLSLSRAPRNGSGPLRYQERMAKALRRFAGPVLLIISGKDYTAREFTDSVEAGGIWSGIWQLPGLERCDIAEADHTFSDESSRRRVEEAVRNWLASLAADAARSPSGVV